MDPDCEFVWWLRKSAAAFHRYAVERCIRLSSPANNCCQIKTDHDIGPMHRLLLFCGFSIGIINEGGGKERKRDRSGELIRSNVNGFEFGSDLFERVANREISSQQSHVQSINGYQ